MNFINGGETIEKPNRGNTHFCIRKKGVDNKLDGEGYSAILAAYPPKGVHFFQSYREDY